MDSIKYHLAQSRRMDALLFMSREDQRAWMHRTDVIMATIAYGEIRFAEEHGEHHVRDLDKARKEWAEASEDVRAAALLRYQERKEEREAKIKDVELPF